MESRQIDFPLFFAILLMIVRGMIMITSVSVYGSFSLTSALEAAGIAETNNYFYVLRNISHVMMAGVLLVILVKIPYTYFEKYAKYIITLSGISLIYVLLWGTTLKGATGWIHIPGLPSIQPVEFLKFSIIIFLAYFFKKYKQKIHSFQE